MGTIHLFLLNVEALDKPLNFPSVSPHVMKKFPGSFLGEKSIKIVLLPGKKMIQIDFSPLLLFGNDLRQLIVFHFHKIPLLYRTRFPVLSTLVESLSHLVIGSLTDSSIGKS